MRGCGDRTSGRSEEGWYHSRFSPHIKLKRWPQRHTRRPSSAKLKTPLARKTKHKNSTEDKSHSENDKFLGPRAERLSLGGNKGSSVYSTPTVIELERQDINNFLTGRNVDATQKTCRFQEVDSLVHLGLRCETPPSSGAGRRRRSSARAHSDYCAECLATREIGLEPSMGAHGALFFPVQSYIGCLLLTSTGKPPEQHTESPRVHQFLLIESSFTNSSPSQVGLLSPHDIWLPREKKLETYLNEKADNGKQGHEAVASVHDEAIV
ncbi:hypothetical protein EDB83DRAFT_2313382 [Lactarius deliciosus]|nr:hypothetical protein EDB83DRAFT_2313382 [Lactarius deliciosus]